MAHISKIKSAIGHNSLTQSVPEVRWIKDVRFKCAFKFWLSWYFRILSHVPTYNFGISKS